VGLDVGQLDVEVVFDYPNVTKAALDDHGESDGFNCNQGGAVHHGVFGPFGLLVLANENLQERTAVFFYVFYSEDGKWRTRFCSDQTRCVSFEITIPLAVTHVEQFSKCHNAFLCRCRCCLTSTQLSSAASWRFFPWKTSFHSTSW
jgi:hypothetical protein